MKQRFLVLKTIEATPLQLANVRSLLAGMAYIEIDNTFVVSCNRSFKDTLSGELNDAGINYLLVYVNLKAGCDVFARGLNDSDMQNIEKIVTND